MTTPPVRYALIQGPPDSASAIRAYLPENYELVGSLPNRRSCTSFLITGRDVAGWTLDGYVLPRLASGLYFGEEVA